MESSCLVWGKSSDVLGSVNRTCFKLFGGAQSYNGYEDETRLLRAQYAAKTNDCSYCRACTQHGMLAAICGEHLME